MAGRAGLRRGCAEPGLPRQHPAPRSGSQNPLSAGAYRRRPPPPPGREAPPDGLLRAWLPAALPRAVEDRPRLLAFWVLRPLLVDPLTGLRSPALRFGAGRAEGWVGRVVGRSPAPGRAGGLSGRAGRSPAPGRVGGLSGRAGRSPAPGRADGLSGRGGRSPAPGRAGRSPGRPPGREIGCSGRGFTPPEPGRPPVPGRFCGGLGLDFAGSCDGRFAGRFEADQRLPLPMLTLILPLLVKLW